MLLQLYSTWPKAPKTTQDDLRKAFKTFIELTIESCRLLQHGVEAWRPSSWCPVPHTSTFFKTELHSFSLPFSFLHMMPYLAAWWLRIFPLQLTVGSRHRFIFQPLFLLCGICILSPCLCKIPWSALVFTLHKNAAPVKCTIMYLGVGMCTSVFTTNVYVWWVFSL